MHPGIRVSAEGRRGCGYRKKGGFYLVGDGPSRDCGRIPFPLDRCPTCDHGIKPTRGWTWVDIAGLLRDAPPCRCDRPLPLEEGSALNQLETSGCDGCPLRDGTDAGKVGLLWVQQGYPTTASFLEEARAAGISRRIVAVPRGFQVGKSWVMLAHRKVVEQPCPACDGAGGHETSFAAHAPDCSPDRCGASCPQEDRRLDACEACEGTGGVLAPGIFSAFVPQRIEVIVDGTEPDEEIQALIDRGLSPVKVHQVDGPAGASMRPGSWADHVDRSL